MDSSEKNSLPSKSIKAPWYRDTDCELWRILNRLFSKAHPSNVDVTYYLPDSASPHLKAATISYALTYVRTPPQNKIISELVNALQQVHKANAMQPNRFSRSIQIIIVHMRWTRSSGDKDLLSLQITYHCCINNNFHHPPCLLLSLLRIRVRLLTSQHWIGDTLSIFVFSATNQNMWRDSPIPSGHLVGGWLATSIKADWISGQRVKSFVQPVSIVLFVLWSYRSNSQVTNASLQKKWNMKIGSSAIIFAVLATLASADVSHLGEISKTVSC